jgi:hypothetical protein
MADMHFMYQCANGNLQETHHLCAEYYLKCKMPSDKLFTKLYQWPDAPQMSGHKRPDQFQLLI